MRFELTTYMWNLFASGESVLFNLSRLSGLNPCLSAGRDDLCV